MLELIKNITLHLTGLISETNPFVIIRLCVNR